MINLTTAAFLADAERYLNEAQRGEPLRIARPGQGALVLLCGGAYEELYAGSVEVHGPGKASLESIERLQATLIELDNAGE